MAFTVTDFQTIAAGILEEDGIVAWLFIKRSFNVACAGLVRDGRQSIDLAKAVGPKRDPAPIGDVLRGLCHPEKLGGTIRSDHLILQPPFNRDIPSEPESGQEGPIKRPCLGQTMDPEINMIETTSHIRGTGIQIKDAL
jgi:hypothetical protein